MPGTLAASDLLEATGFTAAYYTDKALRFGATPLGVDWSCLPTQQMRFVQLLRICDFTAPFSINDLGCGYGALLDMLVEDYPSCGIEYRGIDLSAEMVRLSRLRHPAGRAAFACGARPQVPADYSVASGIFNVRSGQPLAVWEAMIGATLRELAHASRKGFAVNFVLPWAEPNVGQARSQAGLYVTPPEQWMTYCAASLDGEAELVSGYGLAEFTLLVRPRSHDAPSSSWARSSSGR